MARQPNVILKALGDAVETLSLVELAVDGVWLLCQVVGHALVLILSIFHV